LLYDADGGRLDQQIGRKRYIEESRAAHHRRTIRLRLTPAGKRVAVPMAVGA
jgi:DNA-binding MarR family transcriptional regulator